MLFLKISQNHWEFMLVFGWETITIHAFSENGHLYSVSDIEKTRVQKVTFSHGGNDTFPEMVIFDVVTS